LEAAGSRLFVLLPAGGQPLLYEKFEWTVEIAVNQGPADREFGLEIGAPIEIVA
jgi:S-adenosylmethionine hydrolase